VRASTVSEAYRVCVNVVHMTGRDDERG